MVSIENEFTTRARTVRIADVPGMCARVVCKHGWKYRGNTEEAKEELPATKSDYQRDGGGLWGDDTPCLSEKVPPSENFEEQSIFCERLSVGRKSDAERPSKKNTWIKEERSRETSFRPAFVYEQSPKHEEVQGKKFTDETVKKRGIGQYRTQLISIAQLPTDFLPL
uniref:Uncharacterized protein n=1 Tax=Vespula pensylvanica TaxID=30213 RepID=A0A834NBN5_VESPE|nr:hypothetical protein H0235_014779 [Vespula pensylvanica]